MRAVLSWLCDFADFYSLADREAPGYYDALADALADAMNARGLVVEGIEKSGMGLDQVVVAKVVEIHPIKGADRIRRIMVDAGAGHLEQIVCGAFNFSEGDHVPLARVGAVLPGDFAIGLRKMRGVESNGMLCSARELALGVDYDGLLLLDRETRPGEAIADAISVVPDIVFDLAIEANRPDANCHMGVARELAVHFGLPFSVPGAADLSGVPRRDLDPATVRTDGCDALLLARFGDVSGASVPEYVSRRLGLAGMRSISPAVDASNYVMLELGQPTHPYDLAALPAGYIGVRDGSEGEELTTLDGKRRRLSVPKGGANARDMVIVDAKDQAIGLAGVMGGESSEIGGATTSVLLEVAHFDAGMIAKTSKRLGLRSEASARFERGVDPQIAETAVARYSQLIGVVPDEIAAYSSTAAPVIVRLRLERLEALLGAALPVGKLIGDLESMGFGCSETGEGLLEFVVPSNRPDVAIEVDLIEEFARHYGYANIERRQLSVPKVGRLTHPQRMRRAISEFSAARGYQEAWSATLLAPGEQEAYGDHVGKITVANPMAIEESVLRRSLVSGMLRSLGANVRRGEARVDLFELGKVFSIPAAGAEFPAETERAAWLSYREQGQAEQPYGLLLDLFERFGLELSAGYRLVPSSEAGGSALVEEGFYGLHPDNSLALVAGAVIVGALGMVNPQAISRAAGEGATGVATYLELDLAATLFVEPELRRAVSVSPYPRAEFDLSFAVEPGVLAVELERRIEGALGEMEATVSLIDEYLGTNGRSLTYRVTVAAPDRTLGETELRELRDGAISAAVSPGGAILRG